MNTGVNYGLVSTVLFFATLVFAGFTLWQNWGHLECMSSIAGGVWSLVGLGFSCAFARMHNSGCCSSTPARSR